MSYLLVFIGGGIGAALRHGVNRAALGVFGSSFPVGTMILNVVGSLAMGFIATLFLMKVGTSQSLRLFVTTGILGGFGKGSELPHQQKPMGRLVVAKVSAAR